jgi:hypothetical protein
VGLANAAEATADSETNANSVSSEKRKRFIWGTLLRLAPVRHATALPDCRKAWA